MAGFLITWLFVWASKNYKERRERSEDENESRFARGLDMGYSMAMHDLKMKIREWPHAEARLMSKLYKMLNEAE